MPLIQSINDAPSYYQRLCTSIDAAVNPTHYYKEDRDVTIINLLRHSYRSLFPDIAFPPEFLYWHERGLEQETLNSLGAMPVRPQGGYQPPYELPERHDITRETKTLGRKNAISLNCRSGVINVISYLDALNKKSRGYNFGKYGHHNDAVRFMGHFLVRVFTGLSTMDLADPQSLHEANCYLKYIQALTDDASLILQLRQFDPVTASKELYLVRSPVHLLLSAAEEITIIRNKIKHRLSVCSIYEHTVGLQEQLDALTLSTFSLIMYLPANRRVEISETVIDGRTRNAGCFPLVRLQESLRALLDRAFDDRDNAANALTEAGKENALAFPALEWPSFNYLEPKSGLSPFFKNDARLESLKKISLDLVTLVELTRSVSALQSVLRIGGDLIAVACFSEDIRRMFKVLSPVTENLSSLRKQVMNEAKKYHQVLLIENSKVRNKANAAWQRNYSAYKSLSRVPTKAGMQKTNLKVRIDGHINGITAILERWQNNPEEQLRQFQNQQRLFYQRLTIAVQRAIESGTISEDSDLNRLQQKPQGSFVDTSLLQLTAPVSPLLMNIKKTFLACIAAHRGNEIQEESLQELSEEQAEHKLRTYWLLSCLAICDAPETEAIRLGQLRQRLTHLYVTDIDPIHLNELKGLLNMNPSPIESVIDDAIVVNPAAPTPVLHRAPPPLVAPTPPVNSCLILSTEVALNLAYQVGYWIEHYQDKSPANQAAFLDFWQALCALNMGYWDSWNLGYRHAATHNYSSDAGQSWINSFLTMGEMRAEKEACFVDLLYNRIEHNKEEADSEKVAVDWSTQTLNHLAQQENSKQKPCRDYTTLSTWAQTHQQHAQEELERRKKSLEAYQEKALPDQNFLFTHFLTVLEIAPENPEHTEAYITLARGRVLQNAASRVDRYDDGAWDRLLSNALTAYTQAIDKDNTHFWGIISQGLLALGASPLPWLTQAKEQENKQAYNQAIFLMARQTARILSSCCERAEFLGESALYFKQRLPVLCNALANFGARLYRCVETDSSWWALWHSDGARAERAAVLESCLSWINTVLNAVETKEVNRGAGLLTILHEIESSNRALSEALTNYDAVVKSKSRWYNQGYATRDTLGLAIEEVRVLVSEMNMHRIQRITITASEKNERAALESEARSKQNEANVLIAQQEARVAQQVAETERLANEAAQQVAETERLANEAAQQVAEAAQQALLATKFQQEETCVLILRKKIEKLFEPSDYVASKGELEIRLAAVVKKVGSYFKDFSAEELEEKALILLKEINNDCWRQLQPRTTAQQRPVPTAAPSTAAMGIFRANRAASPAPGDAYNPSYS